MILVSSGGSPHLIYPGETPDLVTLITLAVNTNIISYPNGQIGPGGGIQP